MSALRLVVPIALVALCSAPAFAGDIWVTKSGKIQGPPKASIPPKAGDYAGSRYTVLSTGRTKLRYKIEGVGSTQEFDASDIARIYFDPRNSPPEMRRAEEAESQGDFAGARDLWLAVAGNRKAWCKDLGAFRAAATYWYAGTDIGQAAKSLQAFKKSHSDSMYVPDAIRLAARALLAAGKIAEARAEFESIKKLAGVSPTDKSEADYWLAWIDEALAKQKKDTAGLKKALNGYKMLKGSLANDRSAAGKQLLNRCLLGQASCQIALGDWQAAKKDLDRMLEKADDPLLKAGGYTLLGNALLSANADKNDPAVYREALMMFLRVVCLYGNAQGAEDYHAESLYQAGAMFYQLGASSADDELKKRWGQYSRREYAECKRLYPHSSWAKQIGR